MDESLEEETTGGMTWEMNPLAVLRGARGGHGPQKFSWPLRSPTPTFLEGYKILNFENIVY